MKINWNLGPQRCRNPEYEAEILALDMGSSYPLAVRYRIRNDPEWMLSSFNSDGRISRHQDKGYDLMPPKLSRDKVARQCMIAGGYTIREELVLCFCAALDHYDKLRAEGLCDDE